MGYLYMVEDGAQIGITREHQHFWQKPDYNTVYSGVFKKGDSGFLLFQTWKLFWKIAVNGAYSCEAAEIAGGTAGYRVCVGTGKENH